MLATTETTNQAIERTVNRTQAIEIKLATKQRGGPLTIRNIDLDREMKILQTLHRLQDTRIKR